MVSKTAELASIVYSIEIKNDQKESAGSEVRSTNFSIATKFSKSVTIRGNLF